MYDNKVIFWSCIFGKIFRVQPPAFSNYLLVDLIALHTCPERSGIILQGEHGGPNRLMNGYSASDPKYC